MTPRMALTLVHSTTLTTAPQDEQQMAWYRKFDPDGVSGCMAKVVLLQLGLGQVGRAMVWG